MALDLDSEEGYFTLNVKMPGQSQPVSVKLDLFAAHNAAAAIADKFPGVTEPLEQANAWREYLTSCGVPPLSDAAACRVAVAVGKEVEAFKKKHALDSPKPESDDSSTPPSSPAP